MSARAGEWHLLGRGRDPVPGSPSQVERLADGYERTADDVERLTGQLRRLSHLDGWKGKAAERFASSAEDLADDLGKAEKRYREAAGAVRGWVQPLRTARSESAGALREAVDADDEMRRTSGDPLAGVAEPTPEQQAAAAAQRRRHEDAARRLGQARDRLDRAMDALEGAAASAEREIRSAAAHGKDGFWDNRKGDIRSIAKGLKVFVDVLGWVAVGLAVLTLALVLFATAPVGLLIAAAVVGGLMLVTHTALVLSESGEATWTDVGMDLLGLATLGVGAGLTRVAGKALPAIRAALANHVDDAARTAAAALQRAAPSFTRAGNASRIADVTNNLRRWATQYLDDAARAVDEAGSAARAQVEGGVRTSTVRDRLLALDDDLADAAVEVRRLQGMNPPAEIAADLAAAAAKVRQATAAAWANAGTQVADTTDQVVNSVGGPSSPGAWKDDVDDWRSRTAWRLTR